MTHDVGRAACETAGFDGHDWQWIDGHHVCVDCALVDLTGERLLGEVAARLGVPRRLLSRQVVAPPAATPGP